MPPLLPTIHTHERAERKAKKKKKVSLEQEEEAISTVWLALKHLTSPDHNSFIYKVGSLGLTIQCWDPVARCFSQALSRKPNYRACLQKECYLPLWGRDNKGRAIVIQIMKWPFSQLQLWVRSLLTHFMNGADILQSQFLGAIGWVWRICSSENMPSFSGLIFHAH